MDPYSGSGTTGLAAKLLGHDYIGFDLSQEYHDMARERIATPSANDVSKFAKECRVSAESSQNVFNIASS